jgi:hypothetical protein
MISNIGTIEKKKIIEELEKRIWIDKISVMMILAMCYTFNIHRICTINVL